MLAGSLFQLFYGSVSNCPCGLVHNALEGLVVQRIYHQLEVGHEVFDLRSVEERMAGINHIWNVPAAQLFL